MKKLHILLFLALGSLVSCDKNNTDLDDAPVVIQNDIAQLSTRLGYDNSGLLQLSNLMASARFKSTTGATVAAIENPDFSLALVAQIAPPDYEGNKLRATHVAVSDNYAYVSYNTEGDKYLGGVDVIDISDINTPRLVVNAKLPNIDISSLAIDGDNLLLAGAADEGVLDNISSPAVLIVLPLQNGLPTTAYRYTALPSYVATDVAFNNESQYVVSGNSGAIARLSKTSGKIENTSSIPDLLAVKTYKNQVFALSGSQGIKVMNNNLSLVKTIETVLNPTSSKRTIDFYNDFLLIAEGSQGLGIYNTNTGAVQNRIAIPVSAEDNDTDQEDIVTNAVTTNAARVFVANGGVGIAVYQFDKQNNFIYLGSSSFNSIDNSSSNFVISRDNYVFVATGKGGLKILKLIELKPALPTCNGTYPAYSGGTQWDLNINEAANYADTKTFNSNVNINRNFTWCGTFNVNGSYVNLNSGTFNMYGTMALKQNINVNAAMNLIGSGTIGGTFTVNGGATLSVKGTLYQGSSGSRTTSTINGKLIIDGEVVVYGNLTINGGGRVEFANANSKLIVYGNLTNWGTVARGSISQIK
ncbi:LVIVD repeat-containing protein [Sphingobacterium nematocida]|uniref:LVIVD repeat-containing protein n=1 Tax=Sphingobacterium nematocida TaxID=1513896 RepID=A0A1T5AT89_9SPHI|nr:hypothetical protein [Sphingobacterium nematocida]SKB38232.1 LVIVD repeat-containing protein [Sphingobacterium nematocida]